MNTTRSKITQPMNTKLVTSYQVRRSIPMQDMLYTVLISRDSGAPANIAHNFSHLCDFFPSFFLQSSPQPRWNILSSPTMAQMMRFGTRCCPIDDRSRTAKIILILLPHSDCGTVIVNYVMIRNNCASLSGEWRFLNLFHVLQKVATRLQNIFPTLDVCRLHNHPHLIYNCHH